MNGEATTDADAPSSRWPPFVRGMRAAVVVLTRIPVGGFAYSDDDWRWSAAYMPIVGAALGALAAGAWYATLRAGFVVASIVAVAASILLTGALHEDGLADTADALGGGTSRERVLAILKDSRIGVFGAAALALAILLRVALLARLGVAAPFALALVEASSRLVPVWLMSALPYVTDAAVAKSRSVVAAGRAQVVIATASVAAIGAALVLLQAVDVMTLGSAWASAIAVALFCTAWFRARVGGITGDFLGAAQQIATCTMLLAIAIARGGAP